jgi:putative transposase
VPLLLGRIAEPFPRLEHARVDQGCTGTGKEWIERELGRSVEVVQHPREPRGAWVPLGTGDDPRPLEWRRLPPERTGSRGVLPRRWVVERAFSWFGQSRRLSKDYEKLCETSEALIYATMSRLPVRRLARGRHSHTASSGPSAKFAGTLGSPRTGGAPWPCGCEN